MMTPSQMRSAIETKASEDPAFRAQLIAEPKTAIRDLLDVPIPDSVSVHVHDQDENTVHLVLPPRAALDETELGVAGGRSLLELLFPHSGGNPTRNW